MQMRELGHGGHMSVPGLDCMNRVEGGRTWEQSVNQIEYGALLATSSAGTHGKSPLMTTHPA